MGRWLSLLLVIYSALLHAYSEEEWLKRSLAHHLVHDYFSATTEAKKGLQEHPESGTLFSALIDSYAKLGDERAMMATWKNYSEVATTPFSDRNLLENMAWGTIEKAFRSSYPNIRINALLGAFFSQDAKGVKLLAKSFRDSNSAVRHASLQLASHLRDEKLKQEVINSFHNETVFAVKLEAIHAVGAMRIFEMREELLKILTSEKSLAEEKAAAVGSLVLLMDTAKREEVEKLAKSDRAPLRFLACKVVEHFELSDSLDLITPLFSDYHADVRMAALHASALVSQEKPPLEPLLEDPHPLVAITAAWALTLYSPEKGGEALMRWLENPQESIKRTAAAALVATGKNGILTMEKAFNEIKDPFVRMNLSLGLISMRTKTKEACQVLLEEFIQQDERLTWEQQGYFRALVPSKSSRSSYHPEEANYLTRLEILNVLAMMQEPKALEATKHFLKKKQWGLTGLASALLLTEGDEKAITLVEEMMREEDPHVRFQAALIVALWGRGEGAIHILQESYEGASRETKERILEGVGRIGAESSIPFLVDKLNEPAQSLRLLSAMSLLQCLYS